VTLKKTLFVQNYTSKSIEIAIFCKMKNATSQGRGRTISIYVTRGDGGGLKSAKKCHTLIE